MKHPHDEYCSRGFLSSRSHSLLSYYALFPFRSAEIYLDIYVKTHVATLASSSSMQFEGFAQRPIGPRTRGPRDEGSDTTLAAHGGLLYANVPGLDGATHRVIISDPAALWTDTTLPLLLTPGQHYLLISSPKKPQQGQRSLSSRQLSPLFRCLRRPPLQPTPRCFLTC